MVELTTSIIIIREDKERSVLLLCSVLCCVAALTFGHAWRDLSDSLSLCLMGWKNASQSNESPISPFRLMTWPRIALDKTRLITRDTFFVVVVWRYTIAGLCYFMFCMELRRPVLTHHWEVPLFLQKFLISFIANGPVVLINVDIKWIKAKLN